MRAIQKTGTWIVVVVVFGLMQLWIDIVFRLYKSADPITMFDLAKDGALLFFVMGITYGITVDFHLDEKANGPSLLKKLAFVFVPMVIMIFVVLAYFLSKGEMNERQTDFFLFLNWVLIGLSASYVAMAKFFLFY